MKKWLLRLLKLLVVIQLVWLVLINGALSLTLTQQLISEIKPEKFTIRWDRAWSWYPGQVTVLGGFANGQSRNQQWQFSADRVTGHIWLLPLTLKRVWVNWVDGENADYRQRPRLREDRDLSAHLAYYPDIEGYPVSPAITAPLKDRRPWQVSIQNIELRGDHAVWIQQFKGTMNADIKGGLERTTRGGPFSLDIGAMEIDLGPVYVNLDEEMVRSGHISGSMGFDPFVPRGTRGLELLNYLRLDTQVDIDSRNLDFINLFLLNFDSVGVKGAGHVKGRLSYRPGLVEPGTNLHVDADDLEVSLAGVSLKGNGDVNLQAGSEAAENLVLEFMFSDLNVAHENDETAMLVGQSLELTLSGRAQVDPNAGSFDTSRTIAFQVDALEVPDLANLQRFIPLKWPFILHGGEGVLEGSARVAPDAYDVDLKLRSEQADLGIDQYRFDTDLDAALKLGNASVKDGGARLDGTYINLSNARIKRENGTFSEPWEASYRFGPGELALVSPEEKQKAGNTIDVLGLVGQNGIGQILSGTSGSVEFAASASSLAFLGVLLGSNHPVGVTGKGELSGNLFLDNGFPDVGTQVSIAATDFGLKLLDFTGTGDGHITLDVIDGDGAPDWDIGIELSQGRMRRAGDADPGLEALELAIDALISDVSLDNTTEVFDIHVQIPSARIADVAVFNSYLPPDSPVRLSGGSADLVADLRLQNEDASGYARLESEALSAELDGQAVSSDLTIDLELSGGKPAELIFDLSGSEILIDRARVVGDHSFDDSNWSARLQFNEGETVFQRPLSLDLKLDLTMSDSRPFVAMFENNGGPEWLGRKMVVEGIEGAAALQMQNDVIRIPYAHGSSDNIQLGMKARMGEAQRDGMIFLQYKALKALLKVKDGARNVDVINTQKKFEEYTPPAFPEPAVDQ